MKSKLPKTVRTLSALASLIRAEFKIPCDRTHIKSWQTRHTPPFPCADENNAHNVKAAFAWVSALQKRKGHKSKGATDQLMLLDQEAEKARANKHITAAQRERFELDREMGQYIKRDEAYQMLSAALQKLFMFTREEIEKRAVLERREKLKVLGVTENITTEFFVWDKARESSVIDSIAKRCEEEANSENTIVI